MMSTDPKRQKNDLHAGHRQRLMSRLDNEGLLHFEEHNILEFLLFYCIPRRDTNEIAHRLLNEFDSLHRVLSAPQKELEKVEGIGSASARYLKMIHETARHAHLTRLTEQPLTDYSRFRQIGVEWFVGLPPESAMAMLLDEEYRFLDFVPLSKEPSGDSVPEKIFQHAEKLPCRFVVLYHSHPGEITSPSEEDVLSTRILYKQLLEKNIRILDHLIIADSASYSLFEKHKDSICCPEK